MRLFVLTLLFLFPHTIIAQTLGISVEPEHGNHGQNILPLYQSSLEIIQNGIILGEQEISNLVTWNYSIYNDRIATIKQEDELILSIFDRFGRSILNQTLEFFDPEDNTLRAYPLNDGRVILRDNVANFTFLTPKGETKFSVSNSSQSADGERESQLAKDKQGRTIVLYNPVILYGNTTGSRAKIVYSENDEQIIFNSPDKEIIDLKVSENGSFISLLASDGGESVVLVFDRFGNELFHYQAADHLRGLNLSRKGDFITLFTSGRVQVFDIISGEAIGSTTSRSSVLDAIYFPEDEVLVILGGGMSGINVMNPNLTAVHLGLRQIIREEIPVSVAIYEHSDITFNRESIGRYQIKGMNKHLNVSVQF